MGVGVIKHIMFAIGAGFCFSTIALLFTPYLLTSFHFFVASIISMFFGFIILINKIIEGGKKW